MKLLYTQEALDERDASFYFFEERRPGLGLTFLDRLESLINIIRLFPQVGSLKPNGSRQAVMRHAPFQKYPFIVAYSVEESAIVINAIFHSSRIREDLDNH